MENVQRSSPDRGVEPQANGGRKIRLLFTGCRYDLRTIGNDSGASSKHVYRVASINKLMDKVVAQSANKGVAKNIFPEGLEPFSEFRPEENIHALFAARSFNARMVTSVWTSGAINKAMIELDRKVKEIMGIEWKPLEDME